MPRRPRRRTRGLNPIPKENVAFTGLLFLNPWQVEAGRGWEGESLLRGFEAKASWRRVAAPKQCLHWGHGDTAILAWPWPQAPPDLSIIFTLFTTEHHS